MTAAMVQDVLDLGPLTEPTYTPGMTLDERFRAWREVNGHVVDAFEHYAAVWLSRHERVGAKALAERLRWETGVRGEGDAWKVNNNYVSRIARELLDRHPEWSGRIATRALATERHTDTGAERSAGAALASG